MRNVTEAAPLRFPAFAPYIASKAEAHGVPLFVADAETTTLREALSATLAARGVRALRPSRSLPFGLAWAGAGRAEAAWRALRRAGRLSAMAA